MDGPTLPPMPREAIRFPSRSFPRRRRPEPPRYGRGKAIPHHPDFFVARIPADTAPENARLLLTSGEGVAFPQLLSQLQTLGTSADSAWKYYTNSFELGADVNSLKLQLTGTAAHYGTTTYAGNLDRGKGVRAGQGHPGWWHGRRHRRNRDPTRRRWRRINRPGNAGPDRHLPRPFRPATLPIPGFGPV